jgi:hypothetical protein
MLLTSAVITSAEPSAESACAFFMPTLNHPTVTEGQVKYPIPSFQRVSLELERYATYTTSNFRVEKITMRDGSREELHGIASAIALCSVDVVDRRVLEISVIPGEETGTTISDDRNQRGGKVKIKAVETALISVGNAVHKGKY